jgi:iron complex outermembrane receptor protein
LAYRDGWVLPVLALLYSGVGSALAAEQAPQIMFDVPAGPAAAGLNELARVGGLHLSYPYDWLSGRRLPAIQGRLTALDALEQAAKALDLRIEKQVGNAVILSPAPANPRPATHRIAAPANTAILPAIVVTAEKRPAAAQRTALALSVLDAAQLAERSILTPTDLSGHVPNMHVGQANNETVISIRGVSSAGITPAADTSVAFHLDGVYLPRPSGAGSLLFDVDRVEVLRGPQGTLYGRNATAGTINVITAKPRFIPEAAAELTIGSQQRLTARGMINLPLVEDRLALRIAMINHQQDGYTHNQGAGQPDVNDADQMAGRALLLAMPADDLRLLLSADYYHRGGAGSGQVLIGRKDTDFLDLGTAQPYRLATNTTPSVDNALYGVQGQVDWTPGDVTLTSLTAWRADNADNTTDQDGDAVNTRTLRFYNYNRSFSQELRLSGHTDGLGDWIAGAYHFQERNNDNLDQFTDLARTQGVILRRPRRQARADALFANLRQDWTDDLMATLGLRQSWDHKQSPEGVTRTLGETTNSFKPDHADWRKTTWKAGLEWQADNGRLLYAHVGNGYKAGGFSSNQIYAPETLMAYEAGAKLDWSRLRLNLSGFRYDFRDLQVNSSAPDSDGVVRTRTSNAGQSTVWGLEAEGLLLPAPGWRVEATLSYLSASFDRYPVAGDPVFRTQQDLSGRRLPRAPRWTGYLAADRTWSLEDGGDISLRGEARYMSRIFFSPFNDVPIMVAGRLSNPYRLASQGAITVMATRLRYSTPDDCYAELSVDNLTDRAVMMSATFGMEGEILAGYSAPRRFGLRIGAKF